MLLGEELKIKPIPTSLDQSNCMSMCFKAKLPMMEIPTFDGQRTHWQKFKDTF